MVGTAATGAAGSAASVGSTILVETLHSTFGVTNVTTGATIIIKIRQQSELRPKMNMNYNTCVETARMFQNMCYKNDI